MLLKISPTNLPSVTNCYNHINVCFCLVKKTQGDLQGYLSFAEFGEVSNVSATQCKDNCLGLDLYENW